MKIICVVNRKGGVGKTTTTHNVGASLARLGKRVLLVDLDSQGNLTTALRFEGESKTIANILDSPTPIKPQIVSTGAKGLYLVPGQYKLEDKDGASARAVASRLRPSLLTVASQFDYCLIDCSDSMLNITAITAADIILIPAEPATGAVQGIKLVMTRIAEAEKTAFRRLPRPLIFFSKVGRYKMAREIMQSARAERGWRILDTEIKASVDVLNAAAAQKSIYDYKHSSRVAEAYMILTEEILNATKEG
jgi:chromosome partitioning protein